MAHGAPRPERRQVRRSRDPVPAWTHPDDVPPFLDDPDGDDPGDDRFGGSAGVREPRHPRPHGPVSGAGEKPMPEAEFVAVLPDPRWPMVDRCGA